MGLMTDFPEDQDDYEKTDLIHRIAMLENTIYRMEKVLKAAYDVSLSEDPLEMSARLTTLARAFEEYHDRRG
jgi:hypothetical protein